MALTCGHSASRDKKKKRSGYNGSEARPPGEMNSLGKSEPIVWRRFRKG
jgi:hypothetical protein